MWNWIKRLFGFGPIKTTVEIMAPLTKQRDALVEAHAARGKEQVKIDAKVVAMQKEREVHEAERLAANVQVNALNSILGPIGAANK